MTTQPVPTETELGPLVRAFESDERFKVRRISEELGVLPDHRKDYVAFLADQDTANQARIETLEASNAALTARVAEREAKCRKYEQALLYVRGSISPAGDAGYESLYRCISAALSTPTDTPCKTATEAQTKETNNA